MSKYSIKQETVQDDVAHQIEQYLFQKAQNNLIFDKEKVHEEFSSLCRSARKENIEFYAKNFQLTLDMNYEDGFFPIVAVNHNNLEALEYFYESCPEIYNKYYANLTKAAIFNQSKICQEFLHNHPEANAEYQHDIGVSGDCQENGF